jgi:hypothetical protein
MKFRHRGAALCAAVLLALTACSGNFGTGTGIPQQGGAPQLPPLQSPMPENNGKGLPEPNASGSPLPAASPATYQIADAQNGFACPASGDGFGCTLSFNLPEPTPAPSATPKHKGKATPTPSPTPTPTPSPEPSGTASAAPAPTPSGGTITLKAEPMPTDAPKLVHTPPDSISVVPLTMVTLTTNADFPLDGWVNAAFTLPADQFTKDRGFAVQLFSKTTKKKNTNYSPIWTFDRSTVNQSTLTFSFKPPKMKIAKGSTYVLVLYGDTPKASPLPSGMPAPATSALPSAPPSGVPSATPAPTPSS